MNERGSLGDVWERAAAQEEEAQEDCQDHALHCRLEEQRSVHLGHVPLQRP